MSDTALWGILIFFGLASLPLVVLFFWVLFFQKPIYDKKVMASTATIWDREGLRRTLIQQCDTVRNSRILWRAMSEEQRQLSTGARTFWSATTDATNKALDAFAKILNGSN